MRAYTPLGHGKGYVDFVIKAYFPLEPNTLTPAPSPYPYPYPYP